MENIFCYEFDNFKKILEIPKEKLNELFEKLNKDNSSSIYEINENFNYIDEILPKIVNLKGFSKKIIKYRLIGFKDFEQLKNFVVEMKIAKILIDKNLDISLYPEIINYKNEKKESDFLINLNNKKIYIEVKRIRETKEMIELENFCKRIEDGVSTLQSPYIIRINFYYDSLEKIKEDVELDKKIIEYIKNFILEDTIIEGKKYNLNEKHNDFGFFKIYKKGKELIDKKETICQVIMKPIPFSGKENIKFRQDIEKKREQLSKDGYNFIFFWSDSTTHNETSFINEIIHFSKEKNYDVTVKYQIEEIFKTINNLHGIILSTKFVSIDEIGKFKIYINNYANPKIDEELVENLNKIFNS